MTDNPIDKNSSNSTARLYAKNPEEITIELNSIHSELLSSKNVAKLEEITNFIAFVYTRQPLK